MKAIVDAKTHRILGAAVLGLEGGELATVFQVAMMGLVKAVDRFGKLYRGDQEAVSTYGVPLVNIVRRQEHVDLLKSIGATHVIYPEFIMGQRFVQPDISFV